MKPIRWTLAGILMLAIAGVAVANKYTDTLELFRNAGESAGFFKTCYGYAVFPTIGKGGLVVGGAHGKGRVYEKGKYIGDTSMTQLSVGLQLGGQAYSQVIFFEDKRALDEFTTGNFEFEAGVSAVAITAAAGGTAGTEGQWGQEGCHHGGQLLLQRNEGLHDREGRRHVSGHGGRPEVFVPIARERGVAAIAVGVTGGSRVASRGGCASLTQANATMCSTIRCM